MKLIAYGLETNLLLLHVKNGITHGYIPELILFMLYLRYSDLVKCNSAVPFYNILDGGQAVAFKLLPGYDNAAFSVLDIGNAVGKSLGDNKTFYIILLINRFKQAVELLYRLSFGFAAR